MLINEIFDSKADVDWQSTDSGFIGKFYYDGKKFEIHIDEYDFKPVERTYSVVDFGFTVNGSWEVTNNMKDSSKILGVILNAFIDKIRSVNPDCILFGVNNKNGSIENRKSLYNRISKLFSNGSSYHQHYNWIKTKNGEYTVLSKFSFSEEELLKIKDFAESIEMKV